MAKRENGVSRFARRERACAVVLLAVAALLACVAVAWDAGGKAEAWAQSAVTDSVKADALQEADALQGDGALQETTAGLASLRAAATEDDPHVDREYLGWLYREGDYWYMVNPSMPYQEKPVYQVVDGRVYATGENGRGWTYEAYNPSFGPWATYYYETEELVFTGSRHFNIEHVALSKLLWNPHHMYHTCWLYSRDHPFARSTQYMAENAKCTLTYGPDWPKFGFTLAKVTFDPEFAEFASRYCYEAGGSPQGSLVWRNAYVTDEQGTKMNPSDLGDWGGLFAGQERLAVIDGIGALEIPVRNLARTFSGCERLEALDLSGFDTQRCTDFSNMLDGCVSLATLTTGERFSQQAAKSEAAKATFPIDMTCGEGDGAVRYQAGEVIPDGAATYVATGRFDLAKAKVTFFEPGSYVVAEDELAALQSGEVAYPEGVTESDVRVWRPGSSGAVGTDAGSAAAEFNYTGSAIRPALAVEIDGNLFKEGEDFTVDFANNVEGPASVSITGKGLCYGRWKGTFEIPDPVAYGFLYENGLMFVKMSHGLPPATKISASAKLVAAHPWLDERGEARNPSWAAYAARVKRIVFDESFSQFVPTSLKDWFTGCTGLERIDGWESVNTSSIRDVSRLFEGCTALTGHGVPQLSFGRVGSAGRMFAGCRALTTFSFNQVRFESVGDAAGMFADCAGLTSIDFKGATFGSVDDMSSMFAGCKSLASVDFSGARFGHVGSAKGMFSGCSALKAVGFNGAIFSGIDDASGMFAGCKSLASVDFSGASFGGMGSAARMFADCAALSQIGFSGANFGGIKDATSMFAGCRSLAALDFSNARFGGIGNASGMFSDCPALVSVGSSGANFGGIADAANMFARCGKLASADFARTSFGRVENATGLFAGCTALESLDVGNLDLSAARGAGKMLDGCAKLASIKTGAGWRNGTIASGGALAFTREAFRVSPTYARFAAGAPIPNGKAEHRYGNIAILFTNVVMPAEKFSCTGKPIQPKPQVKLGGVVLEEGVDYTLSYRDNLYPGKASVTILGKGSFSGGYIVPFTITAPVVKVGDKLTYKTKKVTYTLRVLSVKKVDGVTVPATVAIVGLRVMSGSTRTLTLPSSCSIGGYFVTVTSINSKLVGNFRSVSTVVVGANVVIIGARSFAKAKKVKKLIVKSARLKKVTNCLAGSKVKRVHTRVWLSKKNRAKYKTWFTKKAGKKGVKFVYE